MLSYICLKLKNTQHPDINNGLWVVMVCQHRATDGKKCATLGGMLTLGEAVHAWGRGIWEISLYSSLVCCEPKPSLK